MVQINEDSLESFVGDINYVMVYGFGHCGWCEVEDSLEKLGYTKLNYALGISYKSAVIDGKKIKKVYNDCSCKAGLTNLVLENYRRKLQGKSIIPIIFCLDIENNPYPVSPQTITSKDPQLNYLITHQELRRAYKLFEIFGEVARDSFRFVKLQTNSLQEINAPWEHPDWASCWETRRANRQNVEKPYNWRHQIEWYKSRLDFKHSSQS